MSDAAGNDVALYLETLQLKTPGENAMPTPTLLPVSTAQRLLPAPPVRRTPTTKDVIRREYNEMPGMRLTRAQVRRLWNLSLSECDEVVDALIEDGFLVETSTGHLRSTVDLCW
jgi:hypothetical protein